MLTLRLALKNLRRNKRRSVLTATVVAAAVGLLVLGEGFIGGVEESVIVAAEDGLVGHLSARPAGYPSQGFQHPVDALLELSPAARAFLDANTVAWTERTLFSPTVTNGRDAVRVRAIGYDPTRDAAVFPRTLWKVRGELPDPKGDEIAVGRGVARLLDVKPGDRVVVQVRTHRGAINALSVRISAVVVANNLAIDAAGILVPADLAHRLIAATAPTHVAVRLARRDLAEAFRGRLVAALGPSAEVRTWHDETAELLRLQQIRRRALDFVVMVLLALSGFGMANTILMSAHERVREVGTLRALGMTEGGVLGLFLLEGGIIGLAASVLGAAWGGGLSLYWARSPIDFSRVLERNVGGDMPISPMIYTEFRPGVALAAVAFGVVVAVVASIYPARVAARMAPAEAVRAG